MLLVLSTVGKTLMRRTLHWKRIHDAGRFFYLACFFSRLLQGICFFWFFVESRSTSLRFQLNRWKFVRESADRQCNQQWRRLFYILEAPWTESTVEFQSQRGMKWKTIIFYKQTIVLLDCTWLISLSSKKGSLLIISFTESSSFPPSGNWTSISTPFPNLLLRCCCPPMHLDNLLVCHFQFLFLPESPIDHNRKLVAKSRSFFHWMWSKQNWSASFHHAQNNTP